MSSVSQAKNIMRRAISEIVDPSPTAAQKLLFGETRRRVPAWHDLDEPVLSGARPLTFLSCDGSKGVWTAQAPAGPRGTLGPVARFCRFRAKDLSRMKFITM